MFYFDKNSQSVLYGDIRKERHKLCDGRNLEILPDIVFDYKNLPFKNNTFKLVVLDPPHLIKCGDKSWLYKKYGRLGFDWKNDIRKCFSECFRVLENNGVLIFKWSERQIKTQDILNLIQQKPIFGHTSGRHSYNHWMCFMKNT